MTEENDWLKIELKQKDSEVLKASQLLVQEVTIKDQLIAGIVERDEQIQAKDYKIQTLLDESQIAAKSSKESKAKIDHLTEEIDGIYTDLIEKNSDALEASMCHEKEMCAKDLLISEKEVQMTVQKVELNELIAKVQMQTH